MCTYIDDNGIEYGNMCLECGGDGTIEEVWIDANGDEEEIDGDCCECYGTGYEGGLN